jgi:tetratricopeptide (TPR) repeat protein
MDLGNICEINGLNGDLVHAAVEYLQNQYLRTGILILRPDVLAHSNFFATFEFQNVTSPQIQLSMLIKRSLLLLLMLLTLGASGFTQSFFDEFNAAIQKRDTTTCKAILAQWKAEKPEDPERYCSNFNYFATVAKKEILRLDTKPGPSGEQLVLKEQGKKGETAGYLYGNAYYDAALLDQGLAHIDTGITKFPNRLDMRFGKIYILGEAKDYKNFTEEVLRAIDYGATIDYKWLWTNSVPKNDPKRFMLSCIQDYVVTLYNTENTALLDNIARISERVLKYEPNHIESLSNLAITFLYKEEYDQALAPLLKAHDLVPDDFIGVNNIAHCYRLKGDKKNAIRYYKLMEDSGDAEFRAVAKEKLKELK